MPDRNLVTDVDYPSQLDVYYFKRRTL